MDHNAVHRGQRLCVGESAAETDTAASAVLVSSNPTNVLIAGAFGLNFLTGYTKYTILPTVVCGVVGFFICWIMFTVCKPSVKAADAEGPADEKEKAGSAAEGPLRYIPATLHSPDVDPRKALLDPPGAIFHTTLLLVTLATLVGTSFVEGVAVWMVTMPAGVIAFIRDVVSDWWRDGAVERAEATSEDEPGTEASVIKHGEAPANEPSEVAMIESDASTPPLESRQSSPSEGRRAAAASQGGRGRTAESLWASFRRRFPTTSLTLTRLPVPLVIFGFSMFILVRALDSLGWIAVFATWAARVCTSPAKTAFFLGPLISWFLCSLFGTNIGSAIVMVEILRHPNFAQSAAVVADPNILRAAIITTALASNLGAFSFTFSAR